MTDTNTTPEAVQPKAADAQELRAQAADEFDRWAAAGRGESMARGHHPVTLPLLERWTLGPDSRVLDVGCGNGWAVRLMLERGAGEGHGVDISPAMVELAGEGPGQFKVASGASLPYPDGHFSHVLSVESLYYYPDPGAALAEWARVTRPGGELGVVIELFAENRGSACWVDALDVHAWLLSETRYRELAEAAGWTEVRTFRIKLAGPIKPESEFTASRYWPSYQHYLDYRAAGALAITGKRA